MGFQIFALSLTFKYCNSNDILLGLKNLFSGRAVVA